MKCKINQRDIKFIIIMSTLYPDIDKLYCYREFTEVNSNELCSMGYHYVHDSKAASKYREKAFINDYKEYPQLKEIGKEHKKKTMEFHVYCPDMMERLDLFNSK